MKHFLKIADGIDVTPILHALAINPDLWNENTLRTQHPGTAHAEVSDIWLMFNELSDSVVDDRFVVPYRGWDVLKPLRSLILDLMRRVDGVHLGRCIVTKLPSGKEILPHVDGGAPATYYTRYQIALQSLPGAQFYIEDEVVNFRSGEIWLINNNAEHGVINNSDDDRIVCIVDIRSA
jgi:hypothetical protein